MKKRTLKNPRKVVWAMRDFINDIHDVTYTRSVWNANCSDEDFYESLTNPSNWTEEEVRATCKFVPAQEFCAMTQDEGMEVFRIGYNFEEIYQEETRMFTRYFHSRCSIGKGFANITLILLHELGHFSSQQEFENYDRFYEMMKLALLPSEEECQMGYFNLPDEKSATDWAIEWLSNPENRKKAKAFEKKFFACFEK